MQEDENNANLFFLFILSFAAEHLKQRLTRVQDCVGYANLHLLPTEDGININKLGQLGTLTPTPATMHKSSLIFYC